MVKDIEDAMDQEVDTLDWMSPETKAKAKAKLHLVADKIGYPDHWRDYSALKIVRGDAFGNGSVPSSSKTTVSSPRSASRWTAANGA